MARKVIGMTKVVFDLVIIIWVLGGFPNGEEIVLERVSMIWGLVVLTGNE